MNKIDKISKDVFVERYCHKFYPCKHFIIVNGIYKLVSALDIYNYCIKNNILIPEHFKEYENMYNHKKKHFLYKKYL